MTKETPPFLPYGRQQIDDEDIAAVAEVLRGDYLTTGPAVDRFEAEFAAALGAPHAVACANGTAALHLAAMALDIGPGDRVIVPAITFMASANAFRAMGAEIVFADVEPDTGLVTAELLAQAADRLPAAERATIRAVVPVHLAGQPCDLPAIRALADARGWALVDDACHALGTECADGTKIGAGGPALSTFSFHPVKTIAAGEGGAVTTGSAALAAKLRLLRSHGIERAPGRFSNAALALAPDGGANPWYHEMQLLGLNYRLSDLQAALAASQLRRLGQFVARRAALVEQYDRALAPLAPVIRPMRRVAARRTGWHLYVVRIDFEALGLDRAAVMQALRDAGIGSQVHYIPVPWQPYYRDRYGASYDAASLPGAARYYATCLSLPLYPAMADADIGRVAAALAAIAGAAAGRA